LGINNVRYKDRNITNNNFFIFFIVSIRNVSLTYLRGLEIAELKEEEDMPMV